MGSSGRLPGSVFFSGLCFCCCFHPAWIWEWDAPHIQPVKAVVDFLNKVTANSHRTQSMFNRLREHKKGRRDGSCRQIRSGFDLLVEPARRPLGRLKDGKKLLCRKERQVPRKDTVAFVYAFACFSHCFFILFVIDLLVDSERRTRRKRGGASWSLTSGATNSSARLVSTCILSSPTFAVAFLLVVFLRAE